MTAWQIDITFVVEGENFTDAWDDALDLLRQRRFVEEGATITELTGVEA